MWRHHEERSERFPVGGRFGGYEKRCIGCAFAMRGRIGGDLMTIEDDAHGSLSALPCADAAVTFFDTGRTTTKSCAGAPVPTPR